MTKRVMVDLGWCVAAMTRVRGHLIDKHEEMTVEADQGSSDVWPGNLTLFQPESEGCAAQSVEVSTEGIISLYRFLQDHIPGEWFGRVWELEDARKDKLRMKDSDEEIPFTAPPQGLTLRPGQDPPATLESGVMCPGFADPQRSESPFGGATVADLVHVPEPAEERIPHPSGVTPDFENDIPF